MAAAREVLHYTRNAAYAATQIMPEPAPPVKRPSPQILPRHSCRPDSSTNNTTCRYADCGSMPTLVQAGEPTLFSISNNTIMVYSHVRLRRSLNVHAANNADTGGTSRRLPVAICSSPHRPSSPLFHRHANA